MKITPFVVRLIRDVQAGQDRKHGTGPGAGEIAAKLWPDALGWRRVSNCGNNGARSGAGMPRTAGVQLWRLERAGLLRHRLQFGTVYGRGKKTRKGVVAEWWETTHEGRQILEKHGALADKWVSTVERATP